MARYKVPSQAASGKDTFSDSLVGFQVTDGTSQLTNTNFDLDRNIPEKDSKNFKTNPYSDFLTLDTLSKETGGSTTENTTTTNNNKIKFKDAKDDAGRSLFGSLNSRLLVSIKNIIKNYPAGFLIDKDAIRTTSLDTLMDITYNSVYDTTQFTFEISRAYNPFDIVLVKPNSNTLPESDNNVRNFFSSYTKYVVEISGNTYPITNYTYNISSPSKLTLTVNGSPFGLSSTYTESVFIKPINGIIEEFFESLDEIEAQLLNRETAPIYTVSFVVPKDNLDKSNTELITLKYTWPLDKDNWNLKINGFEYENYITNISDVANEIDDYKSHLIVRFLSSPQLFEFDTDDKKTESIFQLYGQSFDNVKKYIDNIAYMRNVSYDGIRNLPDILLKNLSETLGLSVVNLFDEKKFEDFLYTRHDSKYQGESVGKNLFEAEYEFYRRLLVNLAFIYKSKGTRTSIKFFLKFLGAPEPLIEINEYVYNVTDVPNSKNLEEDIYDVLIGGKQFVSAIFDTDTNQYVKVTTTGSTTFSRDGYPVDETTGLPRRASSLSNDIFFQKGAGWYNSTLDHRSPDIIDEENSILTGRTKTIKTMMKPYTYGEDYFDVFRTLPGLDVGYELSSDIDNVKSHIYDEKTKYTLNRKNVDVFISSSNAIDYDIWRKSKELGLSFGELTPQTGVTFAEFVDKTIHKVVTNSNIIRYKKSYTSLENVYYSYLTTNGFTKYSFIDSNEFINKMSPYWTEVINQIIPATTLWRGGNLISNGKFGRSKYTYRLGCQPKEITEILFPDFETVIEEDLESILGDKDNLRGLINLTGVTYTPIFEIDGVVYSDESCTVILSGNTNTTNSAKLFDIFTITGCTSLTSGSTQIPLICDYKTYINPDVDKIKELWKTAISNLIDNVINQTITGETSEYLPILTYEFITDINGVEKIKLTSVKYSNNNCSVNDYIKYRYEAEYTPINPECGVIDVFTDGSVYSGGTEFCDLVSDVYINVSGLTGVQNGDTSWPVYVYSDCDPTNFNENAILPSGRTLTLEPNCTILISNVKERDNINLNIIDASNCEVNLKIKGLQLNCKTIDINTTGYTIEPIVEYKNTYNHGLKHNSYVYVNVSGVTINETTTNTDILNYINNGDIVLTQVKDVNVNDEVISGYYLSCSSLSNKDFQLATQSGYSFTFVYSSVTISDITCLGSIKTTQITGLTKNNTTTIFDVLPTTKLRVYSNKEVVKSETQTIGILSYFNTPINVTTNQINTFNCGSDSITKTNYHLDNRYPEDLQIKTEEVEIPCCSYDKTYLNNHGDYLIDVYGNPIEVIDVNTNYCDPNLYYNFSISGGTIPSDLIIFNGNINNQILLSHEYSEHSSNMGFDLDQYCLTPMDPRPIYGVECNNTPI